jgi:hypothetical protein
MMAVAGVMSRYIASTGREASISRRESKRITLHRASQQDEAIR